MNELRQDLIRSVAAECGAARAVRFTLTSFASFQVSEAGRTYRHGFLEAGTLDEAVVEALTKKLFSHKDTLVIREEVERGIRIHVYQIKQKSKARYVFQDHVQRAVRDLYPAHVCTIDGSVLV